MDRRICHAIAEHALLMFGDRGAVRVVEPHLYGRNTAGHDALSAWMRPGWSRTDPDGGWRWKDVQDLAPSLASGRISQDELVAVLAEAAHVAELLDRGDRWWAPWDDWVPSDGVG